MKPIMRPLAVLMLSALVLSPTSPADAEPLSVEPMRPAVALAVHFDLTPEIIIQAIADLEEEARLQAEREIAEYLASVEAERLAAAEAERRLAAAQRQQATGSRWEGCKAPMVADVGQMQAIVAQAAEEWGVSAYQLMRIPPRESGWNPDVQHCGSGACGLFQHMPAYWPARAERIGMPGADCRDPLANARAAAMLFLHSGFGPWAPSGPY